MNFFSNNDFYFFIPELYIFFSFCILIFFFSIIKINNLLNFYITTRFNIFTIFFLFNVLLLYIWDMDAIKNNIYIFNFFFKKNLISNFASIFIIILTLVFITFILFYNKITALINFVYEYIIIALFAVFGFLLLIISNDLLVFYICFEIASLSLYVLISFNVQSSFSINSGIKYYILGAISSALMLLGISFFYGLTGLTNFNDIKTLLFFTDYNDIHNVLIIISIIFILLSLLFKIGIFPFHFWIADIYSGISYKTIFFLFLIPKASFIFILINFYYNVFANAIITINSLFIFLAVLSILVATFCALMQKTIKKLLAFSSIVNVGYLLLLITTFSAYSIIYIISYLIVYFLNLITFFIFLLTLKKIVGYYEINITYISQLSNLFKINPLISISLAISIFSIAGLPPFGGFYTKYFILIDLINNKYYTVVIILLLLSIVSTFYYIRIIKILFFNKNLNNNLNYYLNYNNNTIIMNKKNVNTIYCILIIGFSLIIVNIFLCFYPSILYNIIINILLYS